MESEGGGSLNVNVHFLNVHSELQGPPGLALICKHFKKCLIKV